MNIQISEYAARLIRSQIESGRFASVTEVVEEGVRRLDRDSVDLVADSVIAADQELQRRMCDAGLLSEIKPPIIDLTSWEGREPIRIEGEPLSVTIIRERR